jgi:hypothetical protein
VSLARRISVFRVARRVAAKVGYDLVPRDVYSPAPEIPPERSEVWTRPSAVTGVDLDPDRDLGFLREELAPYLVEFADVLRTGIPGGFTLWNGYYQSGDAEVLYAMVRHLKPRRIIEIGSGYSTLVTAAACVRNAAEGAPVAFTAVDPTPRTAPAVLGVTRFDPTPAERLPLDVFLELDDGDVLFVDSSHVVKLGGEVNRLVLDVLPGLGPGVVVHFHDVFWPYEYPRAWYERGTYATEQYVLQAFLAGNRDYRIVFAAHALARARRTELEELVPSLRERPDHAPAALWLRRTS